MKQVAGRALIAALRRHGWHVARVVGSHHILVKAGWSSDYVKGVIVRKSPFRQQCYALAATAFAGAVLGSVASCPATAAPVTAGDWPCWRGPRLNNHAAPDQRPPLAWSATSNIAWRVALPGVGHATPCLVGDRLCVPAADAREQAIWLLCLDRATGRTLWRTEVFRGPFPKIHGDNSPASATPACDGERVYFPYQTTQAVCLAAVQLDGRLAWNRPVAPFASIQGFSASPALHKALVIVPVDGSLGQHLVALDRATGREVWRAPLPASRESYASPLVARVAGRDQALIVGGIRTASYDADTGAPLWSCAGPAEFCAATVACGPDTVYATGGYPEKALLAIRADGAGDVTGTHVRWKSDKKAGYVPSPLLDGDRLWAVSDTGLLRCYAAATGAVAWEHDFKAPFYSSPVLADDRLYLFDRKGKGYVVAAAPPFGVLAENTLPQGVFATPVIVGGRIYLRTLQDLYCLGGQP